MLDMSVPAVAKLRRLLDSLPREALPDILTSIIRTSNKEKLQVSVPLWNATLLCHFLFDLGSKFWLSGKRYWRPTEVIKVVYT